MKSTLEDVGPWRKSLTITVEADEVERVMDRAIARYQRKAALPGFRPGKVPSDLVAANFRGNLESDVLNEILPRATDEAVREHGLQLASSPSIRDLRFRPGEPLTFTAVVEIWPRIEVKGLDSIEVDEVLQEVGDDTVEEFLQGLRERSAEFLPQARPSEAGDIVNMTVQAVDLNGNRLPRAKKQTVRMEAGGANLLPEFREVSLGLQAGDTRVIHVNYPDDFQDRELAGKQRHYKLHVAEILEKKLPDLDDDFAGSIDGTESLEALRSRIRLRLEAEERLRARRRTEETAVDRLIELNPVDLPPEMVERSLDRALERAREQNPGVDEAEFRTAYTPLVERLRRREILLDSLSVQERLELSEEELNEELRSLAQPGVEPEAIRRKLEKEEKLDQVMHDIWERKVLNHLLKRATVNRVKEPAARQPEQKPNIIIP